MSLADYIAETKRWIAAEKAAGGKLPRHEEDAFLERLDALWDGLNEAERGEVNEKIESVVNPFNKPLIGKRCPHDDFEDEPPRCNICDAWICTKCKILLANPIGLCGPCANTLSGESP